MFAFLLDFIAEIKCKSILIYVHAMTAKVSPLSAPPLPLKQSLKLFFHFHQPLSATKHSSRLLFDFIWENPAILFRMLHIFHSIWIQHWNHFRPQGLKRCWIRISSLVVRRPWFCSSAPNGEFSTRPKSIGICCRCPYGCAPNACGRWRHAWSSSKDPLGCLVLSRRLSWCGGSCCRWQSGPEQLRASRGE